MSATVGILIFDEVEVLDVAGPFEVFSITEVHHKKAFDCFTVSEKDTLVSGRNGFLMKAAHTIHRCPKLDILIVPGGYGAETVERGNKTLLAWIAHQHAGARITASVCTGAFLLAQAGVITDHRVTTHWMDADELQRCFGALRVVRGEKFVDQGSIVTSAGISAGIEMSLHIVERECGTDVARQTARRMEYHGRF